MTGARPHAIAVEACARPLRRVRRPIRGRRRRHTSRRAPAVALGALAALGVLGCGRLPPPAAIPSAGTIAPAATDEEAILQARSAQNDAIRARDWDRVASYWTDDVTIRSGLGFTLSGLEAYREAFGSDASVTYVRSTEEVRVSPHWPLAWEAGRWVGRDATTGDALVSGTYAAQWRRSEDGRWRIRSELFVALACEGAGCDWTVHR